ncbi:MAG: hypothetical protein ACYDCQ_08010 [Dehalococcoidia bacterium]
MNPRRATGFDWDSRPGGNVDHLARRGIEWWEVEEIFLNRPEWRRNKKAAAGEYRMIGRSDGGKLCEIIVLTLPDVGELHAITGWRI